jgi:ferredoxin-NADP reductase
MQTEKDWSELNGLNSGLKNICLETNAHVVFICGESGIHEVFSLVKSMLKDKHDCCLSLIYFTSAYLSQPLYKAELENLEKRFPTKLITHYLFANKQDHPENIEWAQQILEIVINSNTSSSMQFQIWGNEEMVDTVTHRLQFLSIRSNQIYSHII